MRLFLMIWLITTSLVASTSLYGFLKPCHVYKGVRSMHTHARKIPFFVQNLFKKSFLLALGKQTTLETSLSDEQYRILGQHFLETHILQDASKQIRFFACAHECMEKLWMIYPKNSEYSHVTDFQKLKPVQTQVRVLLKMLNKLQEDK